MRCPVCENFLFRETDYDPLLIKFQCPTCKATYVFESWSVYEDYLKRTWGKAERGKTVEIPNPSLRQRR